MSASVLDTLLTTLKVSDSPGLETVDPRFVEIIDLVAAKDHEAVLQRVQALVDAEIYDIRLITQYMLCEFEIQGIAVLRPAFECLEGVLGSNLLAIGPVTRREQHVGKSVAWLCETMTDRIVYHASKRDDRWKQWLAADRLALGEAIDALDRIGERISAPSFGGSALVVGHLARWLRELHSETEVAGAPGSEPPLGVVPTSATHGHSVSPPAPVSESSPNAFERNLEQDGAGGLSGPSVPKPITLRGSYPLQGLLRKLAAFEALVQAGKFDRAALICDDLHELMDHFDPREYFPEIFSNFGRLLTENIAELEVQWEHRDGATWNAMRQFSRVDLQGFVERD